MILPNMSRSEVLDRLESIVPKFLEKGSLKIAHLEKKSLKKLPKRLRSKYPIEDQECIIFYFPHMPGWYAWIKFRLDTQVAGKTWKDYPMYALIEWVNNGQPKVMIHRKHALDRYNERLNLRLTGVDDILEEMSHSDGNRIYNYKEITGTNRLLIGNSQNGVFLGFRDRETGYKEIYTFITNQMIKEGQKPDPTDELMEEIALFENTVGRENTVNIIDILTK